MGRIAEESIQKVMAAVNIADLIGGYFPLKRSGTGFVACCPFHNERTPSFHVTPSRNTFHCFGCGKGGGAIRFVMDYENLPFVDAVRKLAGKYGIHLIEEAGTEAESDAARSLRAKLLLLHRDVAQWFHQLLLKSPAAAAARDYLRGRGLNSEIARRWKIGYAPADPASYRQWLTQAGYSETQLVQGGVFSPRDEHMPERGGYPRFKHRVMFPICNDHGDVIAFSGRVLDAEASPAKYVNSPATPIFKKSEVFFGLEKSKKGIHKAGHAVICEGQIDMIMCFEHGIDNIVAPLGTAFTPDHARLLRRHTEQVVLCFDADSAGLKAAQSCFAELSKEGVFVRVATLPQGEDPDSLLRKEGVEALRQRLGSARDFTDFLMDLKALSANPDSLRDRMELLRSVAGGIAKLRDRAAQDTAIDRAAVRLNVSAAELRRMVTAHAKQMLRSQRAMAEREAARHEESPEFEPAPAAIDSPALRHLLQLALTDQTAHEWLAMQPAELPWSGFAGGELLTKLLQSGIQPHVSGSVSAWLASLPRDEESLLAAVLHERLPASGQDAAARAVLSLRLHAVRQRLEILAAKQKQPGIGKDEVLRLVTEIAPLQAEVRRLQSELANIPAA